MKTIVNVPTKQSLIRETRDYLMIALGLILYGIGWTVFLLPNDITTGGVPGIASIVYFATGFPVQYTYFSINFILLLLSIRILGWKFSIKTVFAVFTLTFFHFHHSETGKRCGLTARSAFHGVRHRRIPLRRRHRHRLFFQR